MSSYAITGELGAGKGITLAGRVREFLLRGRPVATNIDFDLPKLVGRFSHAKLTRLPDHPSAEELWALGHGAGGSKDERLFGAIVLDEAATFLNCRDWDAKDRRSVINYLLHSRKMGWHLFLGVQDVDSIDKQIKKSIVEHRVICKRSDRFGVPVLSWLASHFGVSVKLPRMFMAVVRYGLSPHAPVVNKWFTRGKDVFDAYDTNQTFGHVKDFFSHVPPDTFLTVGERRFRRWVKWVRLAPVVLAFAWLSVPGYKLATAKAGGEGGLQNVGPVHGGVLPVVVRSAGQFVGFDTAGKRVEGRLARYGGAVVYQSSDGKSVYSVRHPLTGAGRVGVVGVPGRALAPGGRSGLWGSAEASLDVRPVPELKSSNAIGDVR